MMFNWGVAIISGCIILVGLFFTSSRSARMAIVALALGVLGITYFLSTHYLYPYYLNWKFEAELQQQPIFKTIAKNHPQEYKDFLRKIETADDQDKAKLSSIYAADLVNGLFYQHLEKAPDNYIELYLKATIALYQYLNAISPQTILKLENIKIEDPHWMQVWDDKQFRTLLAHLLDTKRYIIEASIRSPAAVPTEKEAGPLIDKIIQDLNQKYTAEVVQAIFSNKGHTISVHDAATLFIQFYNLILAGGPENAGKTMRYMAYLKNQKTKK